jgi:hypothetical protein
VKPVSKYRKQASSERQLPLFSDVVRFFIKDPRMGRRDSSVVDRRRARAVPEIASIMPIECIFSTDRRERMLARVPARLQWSGVAHPSAPATLQRSTARVRAA